MGQVIKSQSLNVFFIYMTFVQGWIYRPNGAHNSRQRTAWKSAGWHGSDHNNRVRTCHDAR